MNLSRYTPIYVRGSGDDNTADGTLSLPFLTAQAAFNYALGLGSSGNYVLDFGSGNYGGVSVQNVEGGWPQRIAVRGEGPAESFLGDVYASSSTCSWNDPEYQVFTIGDNGKNVHITSDGSINLGDVSSNGSSSCNLPGPLVEGGNGGQIRLKDAVCGLVSANGGSVGDSAGDGGTVILENVSCGNITAKAPVDTYVAGTGGNVSLTDSQAGNIDASSEQTSASDVRGPGGNITLNASTALILNVIGSNGNNGLVTVLGGSTYSSILCNDPTCLAYFSLYYTNESDDEKWQTLSNWNSSPDGSGETPEEIPWTSAATNTFNLFLGDGITSAPELNGLLLGGNSANSAISAQCDRIIALEILNNGLNVINSIPN
jgi:hypothetical protein